MRSALRARVSLRHHFSTAPPPATEATKAASESASSEGGDGWRPLIRAGLGILCVGIPWWFLSQVHDDAELRHALEDDAPSVIAAIARAVPVALPLEAARAYRETERPSGTVRVVATWPGVATRTFDVPAIARVSDTLPLDSGATLSVADPPAPLLTVPSLTASARRAFGGAQTPAELFAERGEMLAAAVSRSSSDADAAMAAGNSRLAVSAAKAEDLRARAALDHFERVLGGWKAGAPAHSWRGEGIVTSGYSGWATSALYFTVGSVACVAAGAVGVTVLPVNEYVAFVLGASPLLITAWARAWGARSGVSVSQVRAEEVDVDAHDAPDERVPALWQSGPARRLFFDEKASAARDDRLAVRSVRAQVQKLPPIPELVSSTVSTGDSISPEMQAWNGVVSNFKGALASARSAVGLDDAKEVGSGDGVAVVTDIVDTQPLVPLLHCDKCGGRGAGLVLREGVCAHCRRQKK